MLFCKNLSQQKLMITQYPNLYQTAWRQNQSQDRRRVEKDSLQSSTYTTQIISNTDNVSFWFN